LIRLEMVEGLPDEEIQERMGIASNGYYRKVKCEALKALRAALAAN
jgi:DNA-directed RNA polymerase specialized sigma24 family protein